MSWALLLGLAQGATAETPLCRPQRVLDPPRAFVGQPVLHRVRIEQRHDVTDLRWEESLSFPAFRAEWIPSTRGPGDSEATELLEERHVLFPARAGRLVLPEARLTCESAGRVESSTLPATVLVAVEPPSEGRPADWHGLVGPIEVHSHVTPDHVDLGGTVSVSVVVNGETNVWTASSPFAGAFAPEQAELFERPAELSRESGRSLVLHQYFGFDLVPRRPGRLRVPEVRVPYFDPGSGRYAEARAPALEIEVTGAAPAAADAAAPAPLTPQEPTATGAPARRAPGPWLVLASLAVAVAAAALLRRRRTRAAGSARSEAHAALRDALAAGDAPAAADAAARALRSALERVLPGARAQAVEELAERVREPEARSLLALLERVEAARFDAAEPASLLALAGETRARLAGETGERLASGTEAPRAGR